MVLFDNKQVGGTGDKTSLGNYEHRMRRQLD